MLIALYAICSNEMLCQQAVEAGVIQMCASFLHGQNNILVLNSTKVSFFFLFFFSQLFFYREYFSPPPSFSQIITKIAEFSSHREALRAASVVLALFQLLDNFNEAVRQQTLLCFCQLLEEELCIQEFVQVGGAQKLAQLVHGNHPGFFLFSLSLSFSFS